MEGVNVVCKDLFLDKIFENIVYQYVVVCNVFYCKGYIIEILVNYELLL